MYTAEDAARCLEIFKEVNYGVILEITPEIKVRFNDAGHMLGFKYYRSLGRRRWKNNKDCIFW